MRHLNRSAAFMLGSLALFACGGPAAPAEGETLAAATGGSGSVEQPDDSPTAAAGKNQRDGSGGTSNDRGSGGSAHENDDEDTDGKEDDDTKPSASGGSKGSSEGDTAGRGGATRGGSGGTGGTAGTPEEPEEPERPSYDGTYKGEITVPVAGTTCALDTTITVEGDTVGGTALGQCYDDSGEVWLNGTIEGRVADDGSFEATVTFTTGRVETIKGSFVDRTHEVLASVGSEGTLIAKENTADVCEGEGCCASVADGTACDYDGDPCRQGECKAGACVSGEALCSDQCSFGTCYTEGECGDAFCDATESHASCPSDCPEACYGSEELCGRALLDVTFAGTHNSHASTAYEGFYLPNANTNQTKTLTKQLEDGIRYFAIDFQDCSVIGGNEGQLCLCHNDCLMGEIPAKVGLGEMAAWMNDNPNEVVILDLQLDSISGNVKARLRNAFNDAGLLRYEYLLPEGDLVFRRTLGNMINLNQRLVVFASDGFISRGDHLLQTAWGLSIGADPVCKDRNDNLPTAEQFYQIEHTRSIGLATTLAQACVNTVEYMEKTAEQCETAAGRRPNAFSVDFYETGAGPLEIANLLNGVRHIEVPYADDGGCLYCDADDNCGTGEYCLGFMCMPKHPYGMACSSDSQCQSDACFEFYCAECNGDSDCGSSELCFLGACMAKAPNLTPCTASNQCSSDICYNGFCSECRSTGDCSSSETCVAGQCLPKAGNDTPCVADDQCASSHCAGVCVQCMADSHCSSGNICIAGTCMRKADNGTPCIYDSQCKSDNCWGVCV